MAEAVSRWPLTAKARVGSRVSIYDICGGQSGTGTGTGSFPSTAILPCQYNFTIPPP